MPRYDGPGTRVPRNTIPDRAGISEGLRCPTACSDTSSDSNSSRGNRRSSKIPKYLARVSTPRSPRSPSPGNLSPREILLSFLVSAPALDRVIGESVETYRTTLGPRHKGRVTGSSDCGLSLSRVESFNGGIRLLWYVGTDLRNACAKQPESACSIQRKHSRHASQTTILDAVNRD